MVEYYIKVTIVKGKEQKDIGRKIMRIINVFWIIALILIIAAASLWIATIVEVYEYFPQEFRVLYIIGVVLLSLLLIGLLYFKKLLYEGYALLIKRTESIEKMVEEIKEAEKKEDSLGLPEESEK